MRAIGSNGASTRPSPAGLELATQMILDLCGGEASEMVMDGAVPDMTRTYRLDPARVVSLVGMDIPEAEQRHPDGAGFSLNGDVASPPSWRPDMQGEADLVEEVARVASLTKLEGKPLSRPRSGVPRRADAAADAGVRGAAGDGGAGLPRMRHLFLHRCEKRGLFGGGYDAVAGQSHRRDMSHMRPDLLPGLLAAAARNQARGMTDLALFELGPVFSGGEPGESDLHATGLRVGRTAPRDPHGVAPRRVDVLMPRPMPRRCWRLWVRRRCIWRETCTAGGIRGGRVHLWGRRFWRCLANCIPGFCGPWTSRDPPSP